MAGPIYYDRTGRAATRDPKAEALDMLLAEAAMRGDQEASTPTITGLINEVDMGGAGRANAGRAAGLSATRGAGDAMLATTGAALEQLRQEELARRAAIGGGRGGGGGGGGDGDSGLLYPEFDPRRGSYGTMAFKNSALAELVHGFDIHNLPEKEQMPMDAGPLLGIFPEDKPDWKFSEPSMGANNRKVVAPPKAKVTRSRFNTSGGDGARPARGGRY